MRPVATWIQCYGEEGYEFHYRQDYCTSCAPFWMDYPVCPTHNKKLKNSGYCVGCKKYYDTKEVKRDEKTRSV